MPVLLYLYLYTLTCFYLLQAWAHGPFVYRNNSGKKDVKDRPLKQSGSWHISCVSTYEVASCYKSIVKSLPSLRSEAASLCCTLALSALSVRISVASISLKFMISPQTKLPCSPLGICLPVSSASPPLFLPIHLPARPPTCLLARSLSTPFVRFEAYNK